MGPEKASSELRRIASAISASTRPDPELVSRDLRRILSKVSVIVKRVDLDSLDIDGIATFVIWGDAEGESFTGSYTQDMTSRDSPNWTSTSGPDPSESPESFLSLEEALYESEAFKDASAKANII